MLQDRSPDISFFHHNAGSSLVHIQDFKALQQQILEGSKLLYKMEATLYSWNSSLEFNYQKVKLNLKFATIGTLEHSLLLHPKYLLQLFVHNHTRANDLKSVIVKWW